MLNGLINLFLATPHWQWIHATLTELKRGASKQQRGPTSQPVQLARRPAANGQPASWLAGLPAQPATSASQPVGWPAGWPAPAGQPAGREISVLAIQIGSRRHEIKYLLTDLS